MSLEHRLSALPQLHLHSRRKTWLQRTGQRQLKTNRETFQFWDLVRMVLVIWLFRYCYHFFLCNSDGLDAYGFNGQKYGHQQLAITHQPSAISHRPSVSIISGMNVHDWHPNLLGIAKTLVTSIWCQKWPIFTSPLDHNELIYPYSPRFLSMSLGSCMITQCHSGNIKNCALAHPVHLSITNNKTCA